MGIKVDCANMLKVINGGFTGAGAPWTFHMPSECTGHSAHCWTLVEREGGYVDQEVPILQNHIVLLTFDILSANWVGTDKGNCVIGESGFTFTTPKRYCFLHRVTAGDAVFNVLYFGITDWEQPGTEFEVSNVVLVDLSQQFSCTYNFIAHPETRVEYTILDNHEAMLRIANKILSTNVLVKHSQLQIDFQAIIEG